MQTNIFLMCTVIVGCHILVSFSSRLNKLMHYRGKQRGRDFMKISLKAFMHALNEDDPDDRRQFLKECSSLLNATVNKHKCLYAIVSLLFHNANLRREVFSNTLEEEIDPLITEKVENQGDKICKPIIIEELLHFKQDSAPPHYDRTFNKKKLFYHLNGA